jgi:hypothetical protein
MQQIQYCTILRANLFLITKSLVVYYYSVRAHMFSVRAHMFLVQINLLAAAFCCGSVAHCDKVLLDKVQQVYSRALAILTHCVVNRVLCNNVSRM